MKLRMLIVLVPSVGLLGGYFFSFLFFKSLDLFVNAGKSYETS